MSGPYDQYNQQGQYGGQQQNYGGYQQQPNYSSQGGYGQAPYGQQPGYGAPPAPDYTSGHQQQSNYGGPPQQVSEIPGASSTYQAYLEHASLHSTDSRNKLTFAKGGFNHGQQQPQYGGQDQYNQQYGQQYGQQQGQQTYGDQSQQYGQGQQQYDPNQGGPWGAGAPPSGDPTNPYGYTRDPTDPNNPQEGERGFLGAMAGGIGGGVFGHKHNHGLIGTLAGAFLGSKAEDMFKNRKH